ncbi:MAG: hypothetical protein JO108_06715 [Acidobacteriaceae bacterium]|nr:hypothetical protein [Acidobacteriaceae bacterium]
MLDPAVSLAMTILNVSNSPLSSLVGVLCDRIDARRVVLSGMLGLALCLLAARIIGANLWDGAPAMTPDSAPESVSEQPV